MKQSQRQFVDQLARRVLGDEKVEELRKSPFADLGFGYDQFGMERETAVVMYLIARLIHQKYFRVESHGHEHVPKSGRCILAGNHSGNLPWDGMMVGADLLENGLPPRAMRAIVENFAAKVPYIGLLFARAGQVIGHRRNFEELLKMEELIVVFPEGAKGTGKLYRERYRLRKFNVGFVELSLVHQAPLVPFAVVGAEEQSPILFKVEWLGKRLGMPYFPITPTWPLLGPLGMLPYPVKYHIHYGEPLHYYREYGPEAIYHPDLVRRLADEYQQIVQGMVDEGVRERRGVFR